jgi:hypothetical protein
MFLIKSLNFCPVIFKFMVIKNLDIDPDSPKSLNADPYPDSVSPEPKRGYQQQNYEWNVQIHILYEELCFTIPVHPYRTGWIMLG